MRHRWKPKGRPDARKVLRPECHRIFRCKSCKSTVIVDLREGFTDKTLASKGISPDCNEQIVQEIMDA